jgi:uncharacterized SAM-binding protein YcdF (DUF218 family)
MTDWPFWRECLLPQPVGLIWFAVVLVLVAALRGGRRREAAFVFLIATVFWAAGASPISAWLLASLEKPFANRDWRAGPKADAVVMLGGTLDSSRNELFQMNLTGTADRIILAAEIARVRKADHLVLGGAEQVVGASKQLEAEAIGQWLKQWGVLTVPIINLGHCATTREEIVGLAGLARKRGWRRIHLVTSAWHMQRAVACSRKLGLEVTPAACDFKGLSGLAEAPRFSLFPTNRRLELLGWYAREQLAWTYYRWRGWL